ncbi:class I SAM-dependent methyltransferase [Streptomyces similanensis]|uniref:Class I SAM-dependent methyltransferase n=2 Tax=Streptomyces similanensis TaxID=1274988 RepID=A0ABP9KRL4_9ACTN
MDRRERVKLYDRMAEAYDRSRPSYPDDVIHEVLGDAAAGLSVLDVGSGTGIASRQMAKRGARVLGLDMSAGMSAVAERHGIPTEVVPFETWDPAGQKFDRVTCAQAWHWMDPFDSAAKAASVLRPGGRLCLFWSAGFHPDELADALADAYRRVLPPGSAKLTLGYAVSRSSDLPLDFSVVTGSPRAFRHMTEHPAQSFAWSATYTRDQWLDELYTHTDHAALPPGVRQNLFEEIGSTIDRFGGAFRMTFFTYLFSATAPR